MKGNKREDKRKKKGRGRKKKERKKKKKKKKKRKKEKKKKRKKEKRKKKKKPPLLLPLASIPPALSPTKKTTIFSDDLTPSSLDYHDKHEKKDSMQVQTLPHLALPSPPLFPSQKEQKKEK